MEKYPRIGGKRERKTNTTAKCPCGAVGKWMLEIQTSPFRGEDETEWRCGEHKDCIEVETELARKDAEIARLTAENARLEADAKLGRMVRAMPSGTQLVHEADEKGDYWFLKGQNAPLKFIFCESAEEALEKAGVKP